MQNDLRFSALGVPGTVWAIPAVHGELDRLIQIHDHLWEHFTLGDRLVYTGNYLGYGPSSAPVVDELLTFRRMLLARRGMMVDDIIYLRGSQEEMWQKLLQLQFSSDPVNTLVWMLGNGLSSTLESYGYSPHDGIVAAKEGVTSLGRWTSKLRETVRKKPGHDVFSTHLKRAAFTDTAQNAPLLFVNAGIDPDTSLEEQGDNLWWARKNFDSIELPYNPFQKVVRGYDPKHKGMRLNCVTATIDNGCGFGGSLACVGFNPDGDIHTVLEA